MVRSRCAMSSPVILNHNRGYTCSDNHHMSWLWTCMCMTMHKKRVQCRCRILLHNWWEPSNVFLMHRVGWLVIWSIALAVDCSDPWHWCTCPRHALVLILPNQHFIGCLVCGIWINTHNVHIAQGDVDFRGRYYCGWSCTDTWTLSRCDRCRHCDVTTDSWFPLICCWSSDLKHIWPVSTVWLPIAQLSPTTAPLLPLLAPHRRPQCPGSRVVSLSDWSFPTPQCSPFVLSSGFWWPSPFPTGNWYSPFQPLRPYWYAPWLPPPPCLRPLPPP